MQLSTSLFLAVQLGVAAVLGQEINKPAAWPNLDQFAPTLKTLPRIGTRISPWTSGNIPKGCRDRALLDNKDPTRFRAFTVFMDDCSQPWYFCREVNAQPSIEALVDTVARVPVGMRQFVGDIVHFAGGGGATAWQSAIVHVNGDTANSVSVFLHEASHCVDGTNGMGIRSGDQTWRDAFNRDTHVADNYARTNHVENFAQYAGLIIYDRFTNRHLQTFRDQYYSIVEQIRRMAQAADSTQSWGDHMFDYSLNKRCGIRWALTPAVNPATGAIIGRREFPAADSDDIVILPVPEESFIDSAPTNCTLGDHI